MTKTTKVADALDWQFPTDRGADTLRHALVDAAEEELGVEDQEGEIKVTLQGDEFLMIFLPQ